ncbi:glycoside-pentoside-hexuronide (GPH):cation symporter [Alloscardovia venturai]|uniref:Glycoside-pentoside-hexuronide (GPH):cation symporter n=1 Tax=Alloscardovia venturai TaxID=1769421 RepID=A0ABW2Y8W6_9BIFI
MKTPTPCDIPDETENHNPWLRRVAFACGNLGQAALYAFLNLYFVTYVSNALLTHAHVNSPAAMITTVTSLMVVIRLAEIFIDPLLGAIIDRTRTKFGRYRFWQFWGGLISALLLTPVYTGIFGLVNVNMTYYIIAFIITFVILDIFYSFRDISYWGMIPAIASEQSERSLLTSWATFTGSIGYNGVTVLIVPLVSFFSFDKITASQQTQEGWTAFAIIISVLALVTMLSVVTVKETPQSLQANAKEEAKHNKSVKKVSVINDMKELAHAIAHNDQMLWSALSYLCYGIANSTTGAMMYFIFTYALRRNDLFWIVGIISAVTGLVMAPTYPLLNKKVPRKIIYGISLGLVFLAFLLLFIDSSNVILVMSALICFYVPATYIQLTIILTLTDSVEYGQLRTGTRNSALVLSVRPMIDKISGALANELVAAITVAVGMVAAANGTIPIITSNHMMMFRLMAYAAPMVLIAASFLIYQFKVTLTEKRHAEIVRELETQSIDAQA